MPKIPFFITLVITKDRQIGIKREDRDMMLKLSKKDKEKISNSMFRLSIDIRRL